jgi:hypothetical protein
MTKVLFHGSIQGFRGRIGNMIFRQLPDGTTVVTTAPSKKNSKQKKRAKLRRSERQNAHNDRFSEAAAYWRWKGKKNPIYAELAAATTMRTAYNFAISDWFHAPEVHCIERREGSIWVQATDNILVAKVVIKIQDEQGSVLEKGEGIRQEGDWWEYLPHVPGTTISVEAWDLAGNVTKSTLENR